MKKFIYCLRDKKLNSWDIPFFTNEDPEHRTEESVRGLKLIADPLQAVRARDMALYHLGYFDDIACKFELFDDEVKLLDYEDYLPKKEG